MRYSDFDAAGMELATEQVPPFAIWADRFEPAEPCGRLTRVPQRTVYPGYEVLTLSLPLWMPLAVFSICPTVALIRSIAFRHRQFHLRARGCCPACAYDLTGNTSGVCPVCGTVVARE